MAEFQNTPEEREALASELALGVLNGEELALARRLQLSDPEFAALVAGWTKRIGPLHEGFADEPPSADLKLRINAQLDLEGNGLAQTAVPMSSPNSRDELEGKVNFWCKLALGTSAIAASLLAFVVLQPDSPAPAGDPDPAPTASTSQQFMAQLSGPEVGQYVLVRWDGSSASLNVRTIGLEDDTLVPELWIIPADGTPRSFGTASGSGAEQLAVSDMLMPFIIEGATLAVTMEDPASAPHDTPTPPIIATGQIIEL